MTEDNKTMLHTALQHHLAGRLPEAYAIYQELLELEPSPDVLHLSGEIACQQKQYERAAELVSQAIAANPSIPSYHATLGRIRRAQGRLDDAVESYLNSLNLKPDQPDVYNRLGNVLRAQGKPNDAKASYDIAVSLAPDVAETHFNLGNVFQDQGDLGSAIECFRRAASLDPASAEFHFSLGTALMMQGRLPDAEACFRQAISRQEDYVEAHCNLGVALKEQGKFAEALACYQDAIALDPDHVDARYSLGVMYMMTKQPELAEAWYRRALELAPDMVSAHVNLSWVLRETGRLSEARAHSDLAYRKQSMFVTNTPGAARTVLLLLDAGKGNVPFRFLFPARENNLIEWMIEYATEDQFQNLPLFDAVFNAIGDPDVASAVAAPLARFMTICDRPVLNSPAAVARTARHLMPELLKEVEGLLIPAAWRVEQNGAWFDNQEFQFPVLVRPLASQGGEGLALIESRAALANMAPDRTGVVHLCNYHDYRSADGYFRKYRVIFVDRIPYPYHLAISGQWMVHYYTANMLLPWKLEEERSFLDNPACVLGAKGMAAIEAIGRRLDLDYAGVDFSILPDGRLLIFEANTTMLAHPEQDDALKFKNPYIQKIFDAFGELLTRTSVGGHVENDKERNHLT